MAAKLKSRKLRQAPLRRQGHAAIGLEPRTGRAKEIARVDLHCAGRLAPQHPLRQGEVEINPLWQEIFDQQSCACQCGRVVIGANVQRPCPARRGVCDGQGKDMPARAILGREVAGIFHTIGAHQDRGERQAGDSFGQRVARERSGVDHLARAVGPAIGGQKHIDGRRGRAALHAAIRQVKRRIGERQEGHIVARAAAHQHHRRGRPPSAAREAWGKHRVTHSVGHRRAENLIRARQKRDLRALDAAGIPKTAGEHMQPVRALERGQPQIGQHEPLRRPWILVKRHALDPRGQRIDARRLIAEHISHRQAGRHGLVKLVLHLAHPGPDVGRDLLGEFRQLIIREGPPEIVILNGAQQVPVAHPAQGQLNLGKIHRLDWQGGVGGARQHICAARKHHGGGAVADILRDLDIFKKRLAIGCRQALAEGHAIARAVAQPVDANLPPLHLYHEACVGKLYERCVIRARLNQVFGEKRTHARVLSVIVGAVFGDAEAVFGRCGLQCGHHILARREGIGQTQGCHTIAAPAFRFQRLGQHHQR